MAFPELVSEDDKKLQQKQISFQFHYLVFITLFQTRTILPINKKINKNLKSYYLIMILSNINVMNSLDLTEPVWSVVQGSAQAGRGGWFCRGGRG